MGDAVPSPPRLCDLSAADRAALRGALVGVRADLSKLGGGAGFCEDRGYGWTVESESGYRESIQGVFATHAVLNRLMHDTGVRLATGATIGDQNAVFDELNITEYLLSGRQSFEWSTGVDMAAARHELRLGPMEVIVRTATFATTTGGQPLSSSEDRYRYEKFAATAVWQANLKGIPSQDHFQLIAVFMRLRQYFFTCDICTAAAGSIGFFEGNTQLRSTSPLGPGVARAIDAAAAGRAQAAVLEHDFRVIHQIDPGLMPAYCPDSDRVYCPKHSALHQA